MKKILLLSLSFITIHATKISIEPLAHHPEIITELFELLYDNMIKKLDPDHSAVKRRYVPFLKEHLQEDALPLGYVAFADKTPIGLCCLRKKPVSTDEKCSWFKDHPDIYPWIAGLFVSPEYREQSIAKELIIRIINRAQELGYERLYLFTPTVSQEYETYIKYGCREIDTATFTDGNTTVQLSMMEINPESIIPLLHNL